MIRRCRDERGAAAVEFAIVASLVLLPLFYAILQVGWLFHAWTAMEGGAREGARYMAVHNDVNGAKQAALADMPSLGLTTAAVTVSAASCTPGAEVVVTVTYTSPMPRLIPGVPSTIVRKGAMQCGG